MTAGGRSSIAASSRLAGTAFRARARRRCNLSTETPVQVLAVPFADSVLSVSAGSDSRVQEILHNLDNPLCGTVKRLARSVWSTLVRAPEIRIDSMRKEGSCSKLKNSRGIATKYRAIVARICEPRSSAVR